MVFTTLRFIVFMMTVFTLYYIIPKKKQWMLLLIASYIFYFNTSFIFPLVLFAITVITYFFAVTVDKSYEKRDDYLSKMKYFSVSIYIQNRVVNRVFYLIVRTSF